MLVRVLRIQVVQAWLFIYTNIKKISVLLKRGRGGGMVLLMILEYRYFYSVFFSKIDYKEFLEF